MTRFNFQSLRDFKNIWIYIKVTVTVPINRYDFNNLKTNIIYKYIFVLSTMTLKMLTLLNDTTII